MQEKQTLKNHLQKLKEGKLATGFKKIYSWLKAWFFGLTPEKKLFLFGLLICSLAIALSFDWGVTIRHGDSTFPQDPELSFKKAIYTWDDQRRMGIDSSRGVADGFPYKGLVYVLSLFGLPVFFIQILLFGGLYVLPFVSMYYLVKVLFPRQQFGLMSFFAGLFYVFNIYVLIKYSIPVFVIQLTYGLLPLFIAFGLQYLDTGKKKFLLYFLLITLANSSIGNNIAFFMPLVIIFGVIMIHRLITKKGEQWKYLKRLGVMLLGSIILSLWWFIPQVTAINAQYSSVADSEFVQEYNETALRSSSFEGHMLNSLRLIGTWTWSHNDLYGNAFFEESQVYDGWLAFWGILMVIFTFGALLIKRAHYFYVVLFSCTFFLGVFLMKGISDPFGGVFMFMFEKIPLFWIFRFTYDKFGPVAALSQAILIGYTLYWLAFKFIPRYKAKAHWVLAVLTGLIVFYMYPVWMGHSFRDGYPVQTQVDFPNAYFEANDYLNNLYVPQQRMVVLPFSQGNGIAKAFQWNYVGMDPFEFLSRHSVIYHLLETDGPSADMVQLMKIMLHEKKWSEFMALAPLFNVDKIVMENNADISLFPDLYFSENFNRFVQSDPNVELERSFEDEIDIYRIPASEQYEKIYVPQDIYHFRGNFERLSDLSTFLNHKQKAAFVLDQYNEDLNINVSHFVNHEILPIPGVYEVEEVERIIIETPRNGVYTIWHRRNDYQIYDVKIRQVGSQAELIFSQERRNFKVNETPLAIEGYEQTLSLPINLNEYSSFHLSINEHFLDQIEVDHLKQEGVQHFGQYPFNPNQELLLRIYGEKKAGEGDLLSISDPSFEESVWGEVFSVGSGKGGEDFQGATLVPEASQGDQALQLVAQNKDAALRQTIFGYDPGALYQVSFDYKVVEGESPYVNLIERGVETYNTLNLKKGSDDQWQSFQQLLRPNSDATGLSLYIYARAPEEAEERSTVLYDNFQIIKVPLLQEFRGAILTREYEPKKNLGQVRAKNRTLLFSGSGNLIDVTDQVLKNASFEEGAWSKPADSKASLPGVPTMISKTVEDAYVGERSLLLSTDMHKANIHHRLENIDENVRYIISLATKKIQGANPSFLIHQKGVNIYEPKDTLREEEGLEGEWNTHRFAFNPHSQADGATLYLYAGDGKEELSEVLYDEVKVYQVSNLDSLVAYYNLAKPFERVSVQFTHESPAYYKGNFSPAQENFIMVFGEAYHPNWEITLTDSDTGEQIFLKPEDHFIINGYANAWNIPPGNWDFELRFKSQRIYIFSIFLSLLLSLGFFALHFLRFKKSKSIVYRQGFLNTRSHSTKS